MVQILNPKSRKLHKELIEEPTVKEYLQRLKRHDKETYEHSLRVGMLCIDLGYSNALERVDLRNLGYSGSLHDIGKIEVPQNILTKKSRLNQKELEIMSGHPRWGFLELQDFKPEVVREIVVAHHEYKIKPYPRTGNKRRRMKRGQERRRFDKNISILAQIVAVSDIYDALANRRAYKKPLDSSDIKNLLKEQYTGNVKYIEQILRRCD